MRGLGRRNEYPVVILLARGAILCNSNFYCNVFVLKQEEQEVKRGLKRKFYDATPILGLQEDAANTTCDHWPLAPYQPCHFVSFLPGEYIVQPTPVWCSLSM